MRITPRLPNNKASKGSALLMVLWLTAALSAIGLAVANNVRSETERTETNVDDARAYFEARGGIERAAMHILWGRMYFIPGSPAVELDFPSASVHVDVIPEASKLNVNAAPPEEIMRLLLALEVTQAKAEEITAAMIDWRTPANPVQPSPFDAFYLGQTPSFIPRHASFLENEELLQVKGMTEELYYGSALDNTHAGLRDCMSIYGSGAVDINTAQPATLQAVGLSQADADTIVKNRAQHPVLDYQELAGIQQSLGPAGFRLRIGGQTMFTLRATARLKGPDGKLSDLRRTVGALVKIYFPGNNERKAVGFDIVRWFDRA
jgi:general secretion pathway protein K